MKNLEYKGYIGSIEYNKEDKLFFGKLLGIKSLISYEGKTGPQLEKDFIAAVDDYLADCKELDIKAEKPFKGSFNVRIPSELHRDAALKAMEMNTSLNGFVSESIREKLLQRVSR
jgi:predicted HicB family RNase H-like nuclease